MEDYQMQALANEANNQYASEHAHLQPDESEDTPGRKRKNDDSPNPSQPRAKRNRYISIACNECKRRKIKCNGQTPCQRCGNLKLDCVYAPNCCNGFKESQEYREMSNSISLLQDQVNSLYHELNGLRATLGQVSASLPDQQSQTPIDPSLQGNAFRGSYSPSAQRPRTQSQAQQPSFRGPTSAEFNFGVAKSSLRTMGITGNADGTDNNNSGIVTTDPSPAITPPRPRSQVLTTYHAEKDPIWKVSRDEALRLCRVYEDEMGLMYPVLDIEKMIAYTRKLYTFMEAAHRSGLMQQGFPGADALDDEDTNILKMVLATALVAEGGGTSELGSQLFDFVLPAVDNLFLGSVGVKGIRLLTMTAMYEFHRDNEGTSWRIIGLTARLCIELGLHRRETYDAIEDESGRIETILLFWSIYVLDRRWSFGTGMPFALQDSDIDPNLPKPEDRSPYLSAMIQYSAIGSKVWRAIGSAPGQNGGPPDTEQMNYLDFQVQQWLQNVPPELRYVSQGAYSALDSASPRSRASHRLRALIYLRANQMRILIHRPVLHSATSIMQHRKQAETVIDVAKDTIRVLTGINQNSDLYRSQQMLYNAFLTSALAVLFLAVSHTPALFAENVREEFYMALGLVRGFSKGSFVGKRLWKTIRVLKEVAPKLGLPDGKSSSGRGGKDDYDPNRSAAVAMAGLAGHNVDEAALFNGTGSSATSHNPRHWSTSGASVQSGSPEVMANDLTSLFEAAGGLQALGHGSLAHGEGSGVFDPVHHSSEGLENGSALFGGDEGLSNILKDLF